MHIIQRGANDRGCPGRWGLIELTRLRLPLLCTGLKALARLQGEEFCAVNSLLGATPGRCWPRGGGAPTPGRQADMPVAER